MQTAHLAALRATIRNLPFIKPSPSITPSLDKIDTPKVWDLIELRDEASEELTEIITAINPARYYRTLHRRVWEDDTWRRFYNRTFETHGAAGVRAIVEELRESCDFAVDQHLQNVAKRKAARKAGRK